MRHSKVECYNPKYAIYDGFNSSGKKHISFISRIAYENIEKGLDNHFSKDDLLIIPCGQCIGCRLRYSMQWANRLLCELSMHDKTTCFFVTLTYNEDSIVNCHQSIKPLPDGSYPFSLEKKHLQDFMKRLRRKLNIHYMTIYGEVLKPDDISSCHNPLVVYQRGKKVGQPKEFYFTEDNIRFFACGEYGSKNFRPHFHLILFNAKFPDNDFVFLKKSKLNFDYFSSKTIEEVWPFGFNVVTQVTWENCAYTARYMMKKQKGSEGFVYHDAGIEAPFAVCSRKPGIGKTYYESLENYSEISYLTFGTSSGMRKFAPPAYFEKLFAEEFPKEAEIRSLKRRELARNSVALEMKGTDLNRDDYLKNKEIVLKKRTDMLQCFRDL